MHAAKRFFGNNKMTFTVERTPGGTARTYTRFTDVVRDTIDARIYLGTLPSARRPGGDPRQACGELGGISLPQPLVLIDAARR